MKDRSETIPIVKNGLRKVSEEIFIEAFFQCIGNGEAMAKWIKEKHNIAITAKALRDRIHRRQELVREIPNIRMTKYMEKLDDLAFGKKYEPYIQLNAVKAGLMLMKDVYLERMK